MTIQQGVLIWLLFMSAVSFAAMGLDKLYAGRGERRIPEKRLFLFAALGGAVGGLLGMYLFLSALIVMKSIASRAYSSFSSCRIMTRLPRICSRPAQ